MITEEKIKARIAQLKQNRDNFVQAANAEVSAMTASIRELEALIEPEPKPEPQAEPEKPAE